MRKIKTMLLVAVAALAAMAFTAPAGASAAHWTTEETPLDYDALFGVPNGTIHWEIGKQQLFTCQAEGGAELHPGDQGEMETDVLPETCSGAGAWSGCEFESEPAPAFWSLQAGSTDIFADDVTWTWSLENCSAGSPLQLTFKGDLTLTPDNPDAMSVWSISGEGVTTFNGKGSVSSKVWGELEIIEWAQGLYGLGG